MARNTTTRTRTPAVAPIIDALEGDVIDTTPDTAPIPMPEDAASVDFAAVDTAVSSIVARLTANPTNDYEGMIKSIMLATSDVDEKSGKLLNQSMQIRVYALMAYHEHAKTHCLAPQHKLRPATFAEMYDTYAHQETFIDSLMFVITGSLEAPKNKGKVRVEAVKQEAAAWTTKRDQCRTALSYAMALDYFAVDSSAYDKARGGFVVPVKALVMPLWRPNSFFADRDKDGGVLLDYKGGNFCDVQDMPDGRVQVFANLKTVLDTSEMHRPEDKRGRMLQSNKRQGAATRAARTPDTNKTEDKPVGPSAAQPTARDAATPAQQAAMDATNTPQDKNKAIDLSRVGVLLLANTLVSHMERRAKYLRDNTTLRTADNAVTWDNPDYTPSERGMLENLRTQFLLLDHNTQDAHDKAKAAKDGKAAQVRADNLAKAEKAARKPRHADSAPRQITDDSKPAVA